MVGSLVVAMVRAARILITAGALSIVLLGGASSAARAAGDTVVKTRTQKLAATFVLDTEYYPYTCANCGPGGTPQELTACSWAIFLQFPDVPGATAYNAVVQDLDPRVNATYNLTGPPFKDPADGFTAPSGTHRFGAFTLGSANSGVCYSIGDFAARFVLKSATVTTKVGCFARGAAASGARAAQSGLTCPTLKYTPEEKAAAKNQKRNAEDAYVAATNLAAGAGSSAVALAMTGVGEGAAAGAGAVAAIAGLQAAYLNQLIIKYGRIVEDPPDRHWRQLTRPAATHPDRIPLGRLSHAAQRKVRPFIANQLRSAVLARCVATAIDRGTTARLRDARLAARQYAAGAACAKEAARRATAAPKLASAAAKVLAPSDAAIVAASATATRTPAVIAAITKNIKALGRAIPMASTERKALLAAILATPQGPLTTAPSALLTQQAAAAAAQAKALRAEAGPLLRASR